MAIPLLFRRMEAALSNSQAPPAAAPEPPAATAPAAAGAAGKEKKKDKKAKDESSTMIETGSVKGTRDWPPEMMRQRNWLWGLWRETARKFAFDEYDAPILEACP